MRLYVILIWIMFFSTGSAFPALAAKPNLVKTGLSKEDWIVLRESRSSQAPGIFTETLMLSSLTAQQRLRIGTIYRSWKSDNRKLVSRLITAGHGSTTKEKEISSEILAGLITSDNAANRYFKKQNARKSEFSENDIYKQIANQYRIACFRVGEVLTEAQKKELDQMRVICGSTDYSKYMVGPPPKNSKELPAQRKPKETQ